MGRLFSDAAPAAERFLIDVMRTQLLGVELAEKVIRDSAEGE